MATKTYSSIHPQTRSEIEQTVMNTLYQHGALTTTGIRLYITQSSSRPSIPLNDNRLKQICTSLRRKGILTICGKVRKRVIWAVKQY